MEVRRRRQLCPPGTALRALTPCAALALAVAAHGQADLGIASAAIDAIRNRSLLGGPVHNPFSVTGNPGLPEKVPTVSDEQGSGPGFELINADEEDYSGGTFHWKGDVEFKVRGYRVTCDEVIGNRSTRIVAMRGHVHIDGVDFSVVEGRQVVVDFANETYETLDTEAQLNPSLLQGQLTDKLYVKGHESYGGAKETTTLEGSLTTCNYPMPHYEIEADSIVVRPGRRIIFRRTRIKVLGYTILKLPFLSIPLNNRTYRNTPQVGRSDDEGYFVKARYGIPLKNIDYNLDTREEVMSKLGIGLGGDYEYIAPKVAGVVSVYHIFGSSDDLTFANTHHQAFSWGTLSMETDYEKDNYLVAPNSTNFSEKLALVFPQGRSGTDRLTFNDSSTDSFGFSTDTEALGFSDQRYFGRKTTTQLDVNYFNTGSTFASGSSGSTTSTSTERVDVHFNAQQDLNTAVAALDYQRSIPIGKTENFIGASDQTPVISLTSDSQRLFGRGLSEEFPFKTLISWGDFQDPMGKTHISRGFFDFSFDRFDSSRHRFRWDFTGDFNQGFYSDDTAQYVLNFGTNMRYDLGGNTGVNLRYNYLRPYGFSPLSIDQTGQTNYLSGDLNIRPVKPLLLGAQTGYDILRMQQHQIGWQPIGLRMEYQPERWFFFRFLSTYETYQETWGTLQFDMTYLPGATKLTVGSTFDGPTHTWSSLNVFMDNLKWGRLRLGTALSYNGYLRIFESEQVNAVYDLHCAEAIFSLQETNDGFRPGTQMSFFIRLKALPYDVPFGVGTRGQPFGFNTGGTQY